MRQSKTQFYAHFVWTTWRRVPLVTPAIERDVYRCIESEARNLKCIVLAIGGMPDHVHLAVKMPATVTPSQLMQRVKGISSAFARDQLVPGELFRWQEGYGGFSICFNHIQDTINYVNNQIQHHTTGSIIEGWEETDEEYTG